jgi:PEP-CTERM motif
MHCQKRCTERDFTTMKSKTVFTILLAVVASMLLAGHALASVTPTTDFLGEWSPTVVYDAGDIVKVTGFSGYFEANDSTPLINLDKYPPPTGPIFWTPIQVLPTPEPGSLMLLGSGVIGLANALRRKLSA